MPRAVSEAPDLESDSTCQPRLVNPVTLQDFTKEFFLPYLEIEMVAFCTSMCSTTQLIALSLLEVIISASAHGRMLYCSWKQWRP